MGLVIERGEDERGGKSWGRGRVNDSRDNVGLKIPFGRLKS